MIYTFVLKTEPMPYVRMTRKGKYVQPRAQAYMANQEMLRLEIKNQMQLQGLDMLPTQTPLGIGIVFAVTKDLHTKDLSNLFKAVEDAMQGVVYQNDCWVDQIKTERMLVKTKAATTYVTVVTDERSTK